MIDRSLDYQRHQRDYSVLGSSIVIQGLFNENKKFFYSTPNPIFLIIKDNAFYHFTSRQDASNRCLNWLKHNTYKTLQKIEQEYDQKYKQFKSNPPQNIDELVKYFIDFTNIIFLGYELPEYSQGQIKDLCLVIRQKYETAHKECFDLEKKIISDPDKLYLTINEYQNNLGPDLEKRKKFCVIKYDQNGETISYDPDLMEKFFPPQEKTNQINGQIAYPGKITGPVKLINKIEEANQIKKGDILVTSMTDPRYLPAMKRAAGFITDEGGITCHAAIVARELKKPCLVGTKIATQVLKDGDLVEVNANNGIIKIIK